MIHKVTLIPGDGTGPEVSEAMKRCVEAALAKAGSSIEWEVVNAGEDVMKKTGTPLPDAVVESIKKNKVAIKGPITTPIGSGFRSVNVALRHALDLYINFRPCKLYAGVPSRYDKIDIVIFRENTEDLYAGIEFKYADPDTRELIEFVRNKTQKTIAGDAGISIKAISVFATERIVRAAFEYAVKHGRKRVTAVHKANIMKHTDGLFLETARKVAEKYPQIQFEDRIVDNMAMQLVQKPDLYDVLVCPNLYGDILSDLCAGLIGGLGVAPGANLGEKYALFEAVHGSAPKYTGQNKVNPTAMILSGVLMLRHLKEEEAADALESAVSSVIAEGVHVTYDMKVDRNDPTTVGTREMADATIKALSSLSQPSSDKQSQLSTSAVLP